ncbi:homeodomain-like protein [Tanacetum coccineum]
MAEYSQKWHNGSSRSRSIEFLTIFGCEQCKEPHYTKDCLLKEEGKTLEEAYYTQFSRPFQGGGYRAAAPGFYQRNNANPSKEDLEAYQTPLKQTREIKSSQFLPLLKLIHTRRIGSSQYAVSTRQNSTLLYKSRQTKVSFLSRLDNNYCEEEEGNYGPKFMEAYGASHINDTIPRKEKDPGSFTLPCFNNNTYFDNDLFDLGASVSVMPLSTYLNLGLDKLAHTRLIMELADRTVKYPKGIAENILVGIGNEEFRDRDDELDAGINDYPSYCDYDKKIHIDCAHNLKFSCMIGFEFTHANFFPLLYVNVMSKKFHNSIIKDKMAYKGNNVIGALMNVPIFVGTFSVVTDFAVLENMDDYRDEGMGDVIFGEPFLREVGIKTRRFEGMITIYNGNDEVTYQMVRSHPRFKHHTNEQCNKIPPLLKVSDEDKMNGILHPYQKLKGFYKGVLKLGPDYIRDARTEEWLTRGHISVHEME